MNGGRRAVVACHCGAEGPSSLPTRMRSGQVRRQPAQRSARDGPAREAGRDAELAHAYGLSVAPLYRLPGVVHGLPGEPSGLGGMGGPFSQRWHEGHESRQTKETTVGTRPPLSSLAGLGSESHRAPSDKSLGFFRSSLVGPWGSPEGERKQPSDSSLGWPRTGEPSPGRDERTLLKTTRTAGNR